MKSADQALYCAKRTGRNQVICNVPAASAPSIQRTAQSRPDHVPEGDGRRMLQSDRLNPWMKATEPGC